MLSLHSADRLEEMAHKATEARELGSFKKLGARDVWKSTVLRSGSDGWAESDKKKFL